MCKKMIHVVSFVLLVSQACNAVEIARWDFEETSGTTATDGIASLVITLQGSASLNVDGRFGSGVDFPGEGAVAEAANFDALRFTGDFSIVLWVKSDVEWGAHTRFVDISAADGGLADSYRLFTHSGDNTDNFKFMSRQDGSNTQNIHTRDLPVGTWIFLVLRNDLDGDVTMNVLVDGDSVDEAFVAANSESWPTAGPIVYSAGDLKFGQMNSGGRALDGQMDGIAFYDEVLNDAQVAAMFYNAGSSEFPLAAGPDPANGAMLEATWVNLGWRAGDYAVSHDLYFGTSFDDVNDGAEGTFAGNLATTSQVVGFPGFPAPDGLQPGTTYYWRVDEVNDANAASPWKGEVWSFSISPKTAYAPRPADGSKFADPDVELSWIGGFGAKLHTAYFGDNFDDVSSATGGAPSANVIYTPGTLELEKVYYWRVDEFDGADTHKGDVWSFTTTKSGGGLKAEYFNNTTLSGDPVLTRVDPGIDFDWGNADVPGENSPDESINVNNFGARWTGELEVDLTDTYTFGINANNGFQLWLDGAPIINFWDNTTTSSRQSDPIELVGGDSYSIRMDYFEGDDVAIAQLFWQSSTRDEQIIPSGALQPLSRAGDPNPHNAATGVTQIVTPTWRSSETANSHQVYFGTDEQAVRSATTGSPEYQGSKALGAEMFDPGKLAWHTTYYWRVDEVDNANSTVAGKVWSFTTADFLLVDDFESYDDIDPAPGEPGLNRIFDKWIDGFGTTTNGALVGNDLPPYAETTIVHGGFQSLVYRYDNAGKTSEATLTLVYPRDWTEEGVTKLSLWLRGASANAADRIYVALNGTAVVYHDDPAATQLTGWNEWVIDLSAFGIDLTSVDSISIGIGTRNTPAPDGGAGTMYFDDIRLVR